MDKCIIEGWWCCSETSEIIILCSKQTQRHFWSLLSCSKKHSISCLLHAMPMYACQLWSKYTQTSMKRLRASYNNAYRMIHHIPRNVSVRRHQVKHCVKTFDAVLRSNLYRFFMRCHLHPIFLFVRFKCLMLSTNLHFSSIIQSPCMMATNCSSCWCIVSVFASNQCCFCVVKRKNVCAMYINQAYKK